MRKIEIKDVLTSQKEKTVLHGSYTCGYIDNFLPNQFYEELRDTFPSQDEMARIEGNYYNCTLGALSSPELFSRFLQGNAAWRGLTEMISSDAFMQDLQSWLGDAVGQSFGREYAEKVWRDYAALPNNPLAKWWYKRTGIPVYGNINLTRLASGDQVKLHIDSRRKLISMILYLPTKDWQGDWGGNTVFYRPRENVGEVDWNVEHGKNKWRSHIDDDERPEFASAFEEWVNVEYKPNRLAFFVMNNMSFHEVLPVTCPPGLTRNVAVINVRSGMKGKAA